MNWHWRAAGIVPGIALITAGWPHWHQPGHAAGLAAAVALAVVLSPAAVLMAPAWPGILVPRRSRAARRRRHRGRSRISRSWPRRAVLAATGAVRFRGSRVRLYVDHITPWAAWRPACDGQPGGAVPGCTTGQVQLLGPPGRGRHYPPFAACQTP